MEDNNKNTDKEKVVFMCANTEDRCIHQCFSCYSDEQCDSFWSKQNRPMSKSVEFITFPKFIDDENSKSPDL